MVSPKPRVGNLNCVASSWLSPGLASPHSPFSLHHTSDKSCSDCWTAFWHCYVEKLISTAIKCFDILKCYRTA